MTKTEQERITALMFDTAKELALIIRDFGPAPTEGLYELLPGCPRAAFDVCINALVDAKLISRKTEGADEWLTYTGPRSVVH